MVLYYGDRNSELVNKVLNDEFQDVLNWLQENDLTINLNPGKTNCYFWHSSEIKKTERF